MIKFMAGWLSNSFVSTTALAVAIVAMQAPAFTREYAGALLQLAEDSRRDIDQRATAARQHYAIAESSDAQFLERLRGVEPSNAETLAWSMDRSRTFSEAYAMITGSPVLLQPIRAAIDATTRDPQGYKRNVARTLLSTYAVQLSFTAGAAIYAIAGLFFGSLLGRLALAVPGSILTRLSDRRQRQHVPQSTRR